MTITIRTNGQTVGMLAGAEEFEGEYLARFLGAALLDKLRAYQGEGQDYTVSFIIERS